MFFGAGAEIAYGLPSGGKFAIEIFRTKPDEAKSRFRELLNQLDRRSSYAAEFLPQNFESKRISVFGKPDYKSLIKSSIEYRRNQIKKFLDNFDSNVKWAFSGYSVTEADFAAEFENSTGKRYGSVIYDLDVQLNDSLKGNSELFKSEYFSAFLEVLKSNPDNVLLRKCLTAFIQLLVGCLGQQLASDLNDQVFTKAPDDIPIFDDVAGFFQIEISQAGLSALEIILEEVPRAIDTSSTLDELAAEFARGTLEKLFELCLDYQALIDSHFRYLYEPKAHWGKFSKISVFLNVVRDYIVNSIADPDTIVKTGDGYYHDILKFSSNDLEVSRVGTVNYNRLVSDIAATALPSEVEYLHGSVSDYYDPFLNSIVSLANPADYTSYEHVIVPFLFTQSGIKPLTSVTMSRRYVQLFDDFKDSDVITIVGFGFQRDDGHVNGMFRQLIEDEGKTVVICDYTRGGFDEDARRKFYRKKLRLGSDPANMIILPVDNDRKCVATDKTWFEEIRARI